MRRLSLGGSSIDDLDSEASCLKENVLCSNDLGRHGLWLRCVVLRLAPSVLLHDARENRSRCAQGSPCIVLFLSTGRPSFMSIGVFSTASLVSVTRCPAMPVGTVEQSTEHLPLAQHSQPVVSGFSSIIGHNGRHAYCHRQATPAWHHCVMAHCLFYGSPLG